MLQNVLVGDLLRLLSTRSSRNGLVIALCVSVLSGVASLMFVKYASSNSPGLVGALIPLEVTIYVSILLASMVIGLTSSRESEGLNGIVSTIIPDSRFRFLGRVFAKSLVSVLVVVISTVPILLLSILQFGSTMLLIGLAGVALAVCCAALFAALFSSIGDLVRGRLATVTVCLLILFLFPLLKELVSGTGSSVARIVVPLLDAVSPLGAVDFATSLGKESLEIASGLRAFAVAICWSVVVPGISYICRFKR